ncbi:type III polyketide synthase [Cytobacillus kochii]|uniref:type III polyketide synthase n=1 Tax=Cytobacillus kochii TaxID=859143 RepID=UPI002040490C|nr:3-oxoacyl-[acyl-carrier-protein] synthase III C-terminal domain-containing protein [Cytobacillus kochii]MCM3320851.1 type III polyketide synthase [Cytobacillus kochii]MCM3344316.1 type III polyketide synthase [Cytobacillus kochii]
MPAILSISEVPPPNEITQNEVVAFARHLFGQSFKDIDRLLKVFQNGQIEKRHFAKELDWFKEDHSFADKNDAFIETGVKLGCEAIEKCLTTREFLNQPIKYQEIDAIFTITSSGLATPSLEARIMNLLPFSEQTKRIPIWGLGCAGGASGLSRAYEYCLAYPKAKVLVLTIELCSLTFQRNDRSKSNLVGTSLFADGVACALIAGDESGYLKYQKLPAIPHIYGTQSTTKKDSLDVMGWDVKDDGLYVIFSRDIPTIIEGWLKPNVQKFLNQFSLQITDLQHFIAHPGGKKVIDAYQASLHIPAEMTATSLDVLREFGNMSSSTILYVLRRFFLLGKKDDIGLATALGPGFSSELLLLKWR